MTLILKLSIAISLLGIIILLILANILEPKLTTIEEITSKHINKKVKIQGKITNIKTYDAFQILSISDSTQTIDVLVNKPINIPKNQNLIIIGTLTHYKNNLQIQAEKITSP